MNLTESEVCHFDLIWAVIGKSHLEVYDLRKIKFCSIACVQMIAVFSTGSPD